MAAHTPFQPITASISGRSIAITAVSTSGNFGTLTLAGVYAPSLLVTNTGSTTLFVRLSTEAVPLASSTDVPISPNSQRIFANPAPLGTLGIAVAGSIFGTSTGAPVIVTPGQGGI